MATLKGFLPQFFVVTFVERVSSPVEGREPFYFFFEYALAAESAIVFLIASTLMLKITIIFTY
jgi:hypothetical protein